MPTMISYLQANCVLGKPINQQEKYEKFTVKSRIFILITRKKPKEIFSEFQKIMRDTDKLLGSSLNYKIYFSQFTYNWGKIFSKETGISLNKKIFDINDINVNFINSGDIFLLSPKYVFDNYLRFLGVLKKIFCSGGIKLNYTIDNFFDSILKTDDIIVLEINNKEEYLVDSLIYGC